MSGESVYKAISKLMPCAHVAWAVGSAPALPWCVYYLDEMDGLYSDDRTYARRNRWIVEYYYKEHDAEEQAALEKAIADAFGAFRTTGEMWVDDESCFETAYYFTEIERIEKEQENG